MRSSSRVVAPFAVAVVAALDGGVVPRATIAGAAEAPVKVLQGIVDRRGVPSSAYRSAVDAFVVNVDWAALQPAGPGDGPGDHPGPGDGWAAIDEALDTARAAGLHVKLRVYAGVKAPGWAKQLADGPGGATITDAAPLPWFDSVADPLEPGYPAVQVGEIGRFWSDAYGRAYAGLQTLLAQRYDEVPELVDVVMSQCSTVGAEPFIRQTATLELNRDALAAAGYTRAGDEGCFTRMLDAHQVWAHTSQSLSTNPFQVIDTSVSPFERGAYDTGFTISVMRTCRAALGARCALGNNSLNTGRLGDDYQRLYAELGRLGAPLVLQTSTYDRLCVLSDSPACTWRDSLDLALAMGANAVEVPFQYDGHGSVTPFCLDDGPCADGGAAGARGLRWYDQALHAEPTANDDVTVPSGSLRPVADPTWGTVPIVVDALDAPGGRGVGAVEVFVDGQSIGVDALGVPRRVDWDTEAWAPGRHELSARVSDGAGNAVDVPGFVVRVLRFPTVGPATVVSGPGLAPTLSVRVLGRGLSTSVRFAVAPVAGGPGWTTPAALVGASDAPVRFASAIAGLTSGVAYRVQPIASNAAGTTGGQPVIVTGPELGSPQGATMRVRTTTIAALSDTSVVLRGGIRPGGGGRVAWVEVDPEGGSPWRSAAVAVDPASASVRVPVSALEPGSVSSMRLVLSDGLVTAQGAWVPVTTFEPPRLVTLPLSDATLTSLTVNATVDPRGSATEVHVIWGGDASAPLDRTTASVNVLGPAGPTPLSFSIEGLVADGKIAFRVVATNAWGSTVGPLRAGATPSPAGAWTVGFGNVTRVGARVDGVLNPAGSESTWHLEWGTTPALGSRTPDADAGAAGRWYERDALLRGLRPATTYYARFVATNEWGSAIGPTRSFTTLP